MRLQLLFLLLTAALLSGCSDEPPPARQAPATAAAPDKVLANPAAPAPAQRLPTRGGETLEILGETIPPGSTRRLMWSAGQAFDGSSGESPVLVVNGVSKGPTLCLTAAIHGDELNGIEMIRRVIQDLEPGRVKGAVIGVPIVNLQGFRRGSRYLPDRRDLNRYFPGNATGSSASRIAASLFENIIRKCDGLVDIHTGSLSRTNLPQLRADLANEKVREFANGFGALMVMHNTGAAGTLRRATTDAGIPAVTLEAGEPGRLQSAQVREGTGAIVRLLDAMQIVNRVNLLAAARPVYYRSTWVRSDSGGILFSLVRLGQRVSAGDILGTVTDPISNDQHLIYSPVSGRVVGMALNQVVMPGFATFNLGIEAGSGRNGSLMATLEPPPKPGAEAGKSEPALNGPELDERPE
ncbi:MAG: M14 family metallopeptidase [Gammaproteobacteria bacterium]|nr:M14 family metallopeptidase [Gammaproteobacteria bacterium]